MRPTAGPASVPDVLDVVDVVSPHPRPGARDLVIEVPHGAQGAAEYEAVASRLQSPLPAGLIDFFHVNTDSGAAELGEAMAVQLCASGAVRRAYLIRSRIPRTFIDCNRVLGGDAAAYRAGGVTPGVPPWVTHPDDHALLLGLYTAYQAVAGATINRVCAAEGRALLLHTYAPRSVDVEVSMNIVPDLHAAYADPERWPLRPEVDLIFRKPDGSRALPDATVDALRKALAAIGVPMAEGATYPLHPITTGYAHVVAWPGKVVCVEVRRDLLTEAFVPFNEVVASPNRVERLAEAFAAFAEQGWG